MNCGQVKTLDNGRSCCISFDLAAYCEHCSDSPDSLFQFDWGLLDKNLMNLTDPCDVKHDHKSQLYKKALGCGRST